MNYFRILILLPWFFLSCKDKLKEEDFAGLKKDGEIARQICDEVGIDNAKLYYNIEKITSEPDTSFFVELELNDSALFKQPITGKQAIASYCATQLIKRLDPNTINKAYGINITIDKKNSKEKEFFYSKKELANAWSSFQIIDKYLNCILNNDTVCSSQLLDTTYFHQNFHNSTEQIKLLLNKPIIETSHCYGYYKYNTLDCFSILTTVKTTDSTKFRIDFLIPLTDSKKIINFNLRQ